MKQPRSPFLFRVFNCCHPRVLVLGCALLPECSFGQGAINFSTFGGGVDAPVTNLMTGQRVSGTDWLAQLYYGMPGGNEFAMVTFTNQPAYFGSGAAAGYITAGSGGGIRYINPAVVSPGATTAFQLRVWSAVLGNNWEEAHANWLSGTYAAGVGVGRNYPILTRTSASEIEPPQLLLGMQGFYAYVPLGIPEPGTGWLASLGLAVFFCRGWFASLRKH